jgi:transposase
MDLEIKRQVAAQPSLDPLRSLKGVGPVLQTTLACQLPELGKLDGKAVAKLVGVAPLARDSGLMRGRRHVWGGRSEIRAVLYMATLTTIRYEPKLRNFYQGLRARGKAAKVAIVAAMRKLLVIPNARMRDAIAQAPQAA